MLSFTPLQAFDEEDEEKYGEFFESRKAGKETKGRIKSKANAREEEEEIDLAEDNEEHTEVWRSNTRDCLPSYFLMPCVC